MSIREIQQFPIPVTHESFQGNLDVKSLLPIMRGLTSLMPTGQSVFDILSDQHYSKKDLLKQEKKFDDNLARIFSLNAAQKMPSFILTQLKTANKVTEYISKALGFSESQLHDEVNTADPRLLLSMHKHLHNSDFDPILSYQLRRQWLLAVLAGKLHMRTANDKTFEFLSDLQNELNDSFYYENKKEGVLKGSTFRKTFVTTHNEVTNEVLSIEEVLSGPELGINQKIVIGRFRKVKLEDGEIVDVYSRNRKKGDVEAIIKSIARVKEGKSIDPIKEIKDSIGKQFVVNGDNILRDRVMNEYLETIMAKYPGTTYEWDNPGTLEPDEQHRGQSSKIDYTRVKISFKGISAPYEVICYSLKDFLNQKEYIGTLNEQGIYDGPARALFELKRMVKVAKILFPKEFYDYNIDDIYETTLLKIIQSLRSSKLIRIES